MRTEYPERYITMGLKIAYYRKKAGYTQEVFAEKLAKASTSSRRSKVQAPLEVCPWRLCLRSPIFLISRPPSSWKRIKVIGFIFVYGIARPALPW